MLTKSKWPYVISYLEFSPLITWTFSLQHSFRVRIYSKSTLIPLQSCIIVPVSSDRCERIEKLFLSNWPLNRFASPFNSSSRLSASPVVVGTGSVVVVDAGVVVGIIAAHSGRSKHAHSTGLVMILDPSSFIIASSVSTSSILWRVRPHNVFWSWFGSVKPENRNVRYSISIFGKSLGWFYHLWRTVPTRTGSIIWSGSMIHDTGWLKTQ